MRFTLVLATLAISTVAFAQLQDRPFQIGYAANLNIGDSVVILSNDGINGPAFGGTNGGVPNATVGNICANIYVFDPQEEEIGCCACLVTPNGLNSLSVTSDLISNNLTPAVPTSVVIKLTGSTPAQTGTALSSPFNVCNPALTPSVNGPLLTDGLLAWGTTLEPASTPGTYEAVRVPFLMGSRSVGSVDPGGEISGMAVLCNFIQANGTGFGICKSCRLGALGGSKQ
jgi:hypothetical protein